MKSRESLEFVRQSHAALSHEEKCCLGMEMGRLNTTELVSITAVLDSPVRLNETELAAITPGLDRSVRLSERDLAAITPVFDRAVRLDEGNLATILAIENPTIGLEEVIRHWTLLLPARSNVSLSRVA